MTPRHLRLFRILIPALLLLGVAGLFLSWQRRPAVQAPPVDGGPGDAPRAENVSFIDLVGENRKLSLQADLVQEAEDGRLLIRGIRRLEIEREGRGPLVISAKNGEGVGPQGKRVWQFTEEVVIRDPEQRLEMRLPQLAVDESAGEARAVGEIHFSGPGLSGRASQLTYGLQGQPGELLQPEISDSAGGRLTAERAQLLEGTHDVELTGSVRASWKEGGRLDAGRLRLLRTPSGRLQRALAAGGVSGAWPVAGAAPASWSSSELEAEWDDEEQLERLLLEGQAVLRREAQTMHASRIELSRRDAAFGPGWRLQAHGAVRVAAPIMGNQGSLAAETLQATANSSWALEAAQASGTMTYESGQTRAEAERADFTASPGSPAGGQIQLFAGDARKARLSHGRTRVAASWIRTDPDGQRLEAQGQVEATLLPAAERTGQLPGQGLFLAGSAVHFLSHALETEQARSRLIFSGSVRSWQGERNLAANWILLDQQHNRLEARGHVTTRIPRESGAAAAVAESDYVQIQAESLRYDDDLGQAVYETDARLKLAEGWLEAQKLEIELAGASRRVQQVRAQDGVRLEFRPPDEATTVGGTADRAVYLPAERTVQLLGDHAPAQVRRFDERGGVTSGRRLRYRLDLGTLEVDSGPYGPARIETRSLQP